MKTYAATFHLNILNASTVEGSSFNTTTRTWTVKVRTPAGIKVIKAKHLVMSTGIGGSKPYLPDLPGVEGYKGVNIHSERYKNPQTLTDKGAKVRYYSFVSFCFSFILIISTCGIILEKRGRRSGRGGGAVEGAREMPTG